MQIKRIAAQGILGMALAAWAIGSAAAAEDHAGHDHGSEETSDHGGHAAGGEAEHHDEASLSPEAIQLYGVTIAQATQEVLENSVTLPARVALNGNAMAHIGSTVEGRITELRVRIGDAVKQGDVLAIISSPVLGQAESDYLQARSAIEIARTGVEVAQKAFQRGKTLEPGKGITLSDFQKREGELSLAQGALQGAESQALAAKNKLQILGVTPDQIDALAKTGKIASQLALRAPMDGEVIQREVTLGEVVGPDRESLMIIADLTTLWVLADVSEKEIARVVMGSSAELSFNALPGMRFEGQVQYIAPVLDARTRKGTVRIEVSGRLSPPAATQAATHAADAHDEHDHEKAEIVAVSYTPDEIAAFKAKNDWCAEHASPESKCALCNPSLAATSAAVPVEIPEARADLAVTPVRAADVLRAGMFGEARLNLAAHPGEQPLELVAVPLTAIQTVEGGPAVFVPVQGEANTFAKRSVQIGTRMGRWVPILSGLNAGEAYVATGSFILKAELGKEGAAHEH